MAYLEPLFETNFLEYASYVIKDRAIPHVDDGLKPVQRRIIHTLFEANDGNFHKVANIVGSAMKYHPHGDASIYAALVNMANKEYFVDKQGNFGNIFTGDEASAARYIECRVTPLGLETLYNPPITEYVESYDGRNKEPVVFPAKIPVLLAQGTEGIAVGMATKILPHNLIELMRAEIKILQGKKVRVYPDFLTGGEMDVSEYDDGNGKLIVRAKLDTSDPKRIVVRELPYGLTTESLISSIEAATKKGKLRISGISDYTTESAEIEIRLQRGVYAEEVVPALYAFTDCEISISCNLTVIKDNRPCTMSVFDVLKRNAERLVEILTMELKHEQKELEDKLHAKTLEQIFIENRIYKKIEEMKTADAVTKAVLDGLKPFYKQIKREVTKEDVDRLLKIPIRRISLYDINKAKKEMADINKRLKEIKQALNNIVQFSIGYLEGLIDKYKKHYPRRTKRTDIEQVDVRDAAKRDLKLRYDKKTGYIGTKVSTGDVMMEVSPYDRILVIRKSGTYSVSDAPEKLFVDKGLLFVGFVDKDREYNVIYKEKKTGFAYIKRCKIEQFILNRSYELVPDGSTLMKMTIGQEDGIELEYKPKPRLRVLTEKFKLDDFPIRGLKAKGLRLSAKEVKSGKFVKSGKKSKSSNKKSEGGQKNLFDE